MKLLLPSILFFIAIFGHSSRASASRIFHREEVQFPTPPELPNLIDVKGHLECQCPNELESADCKLTFTRILDGKNFKLVDLPNMSMQKLEKYCNQDVVLTGLTTMTMIFLDDRLKPSSIKALTTSTSHEAHQPRNHPQPSSLQERRDLELSR